VHQAASSLVQACEVREQYEVRISAPYRTLMPPSSPAARPNAGTASKAAICPGAERDHVGKASQEMLPPALIAGVPRERAGQLPASAGFWAVVTHAGRPLELPGVGGMC